MPLVQVAWNMAATFRSGMYIQARSLKPWVLREGGGGGLWGLMGFLAGVNHALFWNTEWDIDHLANISFLSLSIGVNLPRFLQVGER